MTDVYKGSFPSYYFQNCTNQNNKDSNKVMVSMDSNNDKKFEQRINNLKNINPNAFLAMKNDAQNSSNNFRCKKQAKYKIIKPKNIFPNHKPDFNLKKHQSEALFEKFDGETSKKQELSISNSNIALEHPTTSQLRYPSIPSVNKNSRPSDPSNNNNSQNATLSLADETRGQRVRSSLSATEKIDSKNMMSITPGFAKVHEQNLAYRKSGKRSTSSRSKRDGSSMGRTDSSYQEDCMDSSIAGDTQNHSLNNSFRNSSAQKVNLNGSPTKYPRSNKKAIQGKALHDRNTKNELRKFSKENSFCGKTKNESSESKNVSFG